MYMETIREARQGMRRNNRCGGKCPLSSSLSTTNNMDRCINSLSMQIMQTNTISSLCSLPSTTRATTRPTTLGPSRDTSKIITKIKESSKTIHRIKLVQMVGRTIGTGDGKIHLNKVPRVLGPTLPHCPSHRLLLHSNKCSIMLML